ncbi:MAG: hypothetical protein M3Q98_17470 [Actinomycetota bacterium]|nr:hypothetical protein [Actinomycetota bacterium]
MSRTHIHRAFAIGLALTLTLSACGGGDDAPTSGSTPQSSSSSSPQPSSGKSPTPKSGATKPVPKGCKAIVASGAIEDIAKLFDRYRKNPNAAGSLDVPKMRKALEDLAKAGDNAPMKVRENTVTLVADMGAVVDTYLGLEGVGKVPSMDQMQREIDSLCVPNG